MATEDIVFQDSQIGKGMKPLAQHGSAVVGADGTFTLLGTQGDVIDSAPLSQVSAKRMMITGGQTVSLKVGENKYNCTPGWGDRNYQGLLGVSSAAKALVKLIETDGASAK